MSLYFRTLMESADDAEAELDLDEKEVKEGGDEDIDDDVDECYTEGDEDIDDDDDDAVEESLMFDL